MADNIWKRDELARELLPRMEMVNLVQEGGEMIGITENLKN